MASPGDTTTMDNLPDEVFSDIFTRLLAKQVAQMRCVSKSWNALLSHSSFIKSHLNRSLQKNDEILVFFSIFFSFRLTPFRARPSLAMDEYGVSESWVKHPVLSRFSGDIIPKGFTSHGEFVFQVEKDDDRIGVYDPDAAKTKTFKMMSGYSSITGFVEYVDSLVWIQPPNREISSCESK